jgi:hypothetical protein
MFCRRILHTCVLTSEGRRFTDERGSSELGWRSDWFEAAPLCVLLELQRVLRPCTAAEFTVDGHGRSSGENTVNRYRVAESHGLFGIRGT